MESSKNRLDENSREGLSRFVPSIPDVLGWFLTFLVVWLVYTAIVRVAGYFENVSIPTPEMGAIRDTIDGKNIEGNLKNAIDTAVTNVTETLDKLSDEARSEKRKYDEQQAPKEPPPPKEATRVQRF